MAEANISVTQEHFSCPVCLELLKDPVALLCGHSFCIRCINDCWDQEDQKGVYSCPQCRQTFTPRPVISKNTMLAEVVETLRKTGFQASRPDQCSAGPEDVTCDFCIGKKSKAIKSCLVCLASYCETHLQPHYESPVFRKHKLVEASRRLQEQICSQHDKLLEVYCHTDLQCICMLCTMDKHRGHYAVSAAAGQAEKGKQLLEMQGKYQQKIQEQQKELQELAEAVESHKHSAQAAIQETKRIFIELIKSIERRCCEVSGIIRAQEKVTVSEAEEVMKQLEKELAELKRRDSEMEKLSRTEDPIYFLQNFQSVLAPLGHAAIITVNSSHTFKDIIKSVSQLSEQLEKHCKDEIPRISGDVKKVRVIPPKSREELLQYSCQFTLDPRAADSHLSLSDGNTKVTNCLSSALYYYSSGFDMYQVLCKESVCSSCYWEVEFSGSNGVSVAVSYKDIRRKGSGNECVFGCNDKSWNLVCHSSSYSFFHNNQETKIPIELSSSRIGVFVDYAAGTLSFYSVSDNAKLLHKVKTKFTQPLFPGFTVKPSSSVKLFKMDTFRSYNPLGNFTAGFWPVILHS